MSSNGELAAALPAWAREAAADAGIDLDAALRERRAAGRAAGPTVDVSLETFAAHLGRHLPEDRGLARSLAEVRATDLYLACGCALGLPAALLAFDEALLSQVPRFLSGLRAAPVFADEVRQVVRERLLCAAPGAAPRIADYSGMGALSSFVRVTAVRMATNLKANLSERLTDQMDAAAAAAATDGKDPELAYLKQRYGAEFRCAMKDAFAALAAEQRNVLRLRFAMQLTIEQVVTVLKVSRATVVRWQRDAELAMLKETQRLLKQRLRVTTAEMESMLRLVRSQLQLSISDVLRGSG